MVQLNLLCVQLNFAFDCYRVVLPILPLGYFERNFLLNYTIGLRCLMLFGVEYGFVVRVLLENSISFVFEKLIAELVLRFVVQNNFLLRNGSPRFVRRSNLRYVPTTYRCFVAITLLLIFCN